MLENSNLTRAIFKKGLKESVIKIKYDYTKVYYFSGFFTAKNGKIFHFSMLPDDRLALRQGNSDNNDYLEIDKNLFRKIKNIIGEGGD